MIAISRLRSHSWLISALWLVAVVTCWLLVYIGFALDRSRPPATVAEFLFWFHTGAGTMGGIGCLLAFWLAGRSERLDFAFFHFACGVGLACATVAAIVPNWAEYPIVSALIAEALLVGYYLVLGEQTFAYRTLRFVVLLIVIVASFVPERLVLLFRDDMYQSTMAELSAAVTFVAFESALGSWLVFSFGWRIRSGGRPKLEVSRAQLHLSSLFALTALVGIGLMAMQSVRRDRPLDVIVVDALCASPPMMGLAIAVLWFGMLRRTIWLATLASVTGEVCSRILSTRLNSPSGYHLECCRCGAPQLRPLPR